MKAGAFLIFVVVLVVLSVAATVREILDFLDWWKNPTGSTRAQLLAGWEGLKAGIAMVQPAAQVVALVAGCCLAAGLTILGLPLLHGAARPRLVVFLSYHHERYNELESVSRAIAAAGAVPHYVPYQSDADHDQLLDEIDARIRRSHAVVCLPGGQTSFLDAEIKTAIYDRKLMVFLVDFPNGTLPNTAQKSFPVLRRGLSECCGHAALGDLVAYLQGRPGALLRTYRLPSSPHPRLVSVASALFTAPLFASVAAFTGLLIYVAWVSAFGASLPERTREIAWALGIAALLWVFAVLCMLLLVGLLFVLEATTAVLRHLSLVRRFRREVVDGSFGFQTLRLALGADEAVAPGSRPRWARRLLACMWRRAPAAHHQLPGRTTGNATRSSSA